MTVYHVIDYRDLQSERRVQVETEVSQQLDYKKNILLQKIFYCRVGADLNSTNYSWIFFLINIFSIIK